MGSVTEAWPTAVIAFLAENLPRRGAGWDHMSSTAYQIGCEALVALGQATEVTGGAVPRKAPELPERLPRWEDVCIAVLWLAEQQGKLTYRMPGDDWDSDRAHSQGTIIGAPTRSDMLRSCTVGIAEADPEAHAVLSGIGLIDGSSRWKDKAEPVLWRVQPQAWHMDVSNNEKFAAAVEAAVNRMPSDIRAEIDRLVRITRANVEAHMRQHEAATENLKLQHGPKARLGKPITPERAENSLGFIRRNDLDWIFFRRWRLAEGWLASEAQARALDIFHDPLAIQMRRSVLSELHPDLPAFSK